jgi:hypothetical protein
MFLPDVRFAPKAALQFLRLFVILERTIATGTSLVDVEFIPHPEFSSDQKKMVASEFGMVKGQVTVSIRRALLFYLLDEMRLLTAVMRSDPELAKGTTLWIRNTEAVARELAGAKMKQAWPKT